MANPTARDAQGPLSTGDNSNPAFSEPAYVGDTAYVDIAPAEGFEHPNYIIPGIPAVQLSLDGTFFEAIGNSLTVGYFASERRIYLKIAAAADPAPKLILPVDGFVSIAGALPASGNSGSVGAATAYNPLAQVGTVTPTAGDTQVALSWSAVANAQSYTIERCIKATNPGTGSWAGETGYAQTSGASTNPTITGLTNNSQYWFRVKATALGYIDGAWSAAVTATPAAAPAQEYLSSGTWYFGKESGGSTGFKLLRTTAPNDSSYDPTNGFQEFPTTSVVGVHWRWVVLNASNQVVRSGSWVTDTLEAITSGIQKRNVQLPASGVVVGANETFGVEGYIGSDRGDIEGGRSRWTWKMPSAQVGKAPPNGNLSLTFPVTGDWDDEYEEYYRGIPYTRRFSNPLEDMRLVIQ